MNVWRLGTRWEETPVLDLILESKVAFYYIGWHVEGVAEDDIIAIAKPSSRMVVALGIAASSVQPLSELLTPEEQKGILADWINDAKGFRFKKLWIIPEDKQYQTADYKQFYNLGNDQEAWNKSVKLVELFQKEEGDK